VAFLAAGVAPASAGTVGGPAGRAAARRRVRGAGLLLSVLLLVVLEFVSLVGSLSSIRVAPVTPKAWYASGEVFGP
jgi:hypothetical protein